MRTIPSILNVARHVLHTDQAWVLLVEIPRRAGGYYRLARSSQHVVTTRGTFQAATIEIEVPREDGKSTLADGSITLPNVSRIPLAAIEVEDELRGVTARVWLVNQAYLPNLPEGISWSLLIKSATANERTVKLTCGHPSEIGTVPRRRYSRTDFPQLLQR